MPPPQGTPNPLEGPADYTFTKLVHSDTYDAINPVKTADLSGRSVAVVGASKGLGKAMAISFAKAGASHIAIGARSDLTSVVSEIKAAAKDAGRQEPNVLALKLDVVDRQSCEQAAKLVGDQFNGKLDVLINNAGILSQGMIGDVDPDEWWNTINVNVKGPFLSTRSFLPLLLKSHLKTVVNVSSVGCLLVMPSLSAYQTSKLDVTRLTEFTNAEYCQQGLIAFCIHPGNIPTDIVGDVTKLPKALRDVLTETPQLSADSLVYLTKERREWLGGRYINCFWDLPELCSDAKRDEIVKGDKLKVKLVV